MKRKFTLMLGCLLCGASMAFAQSGVKVRNVASSGSLYAKSAASRAPEKPQGNADQVVNDEKELGVKMWAVTNIDYSRDPGFVYFYSKATADLHKTGLLRPYEQDEQRRWNLAAGTYHNGKYLGYLYFRFDMAYKGAREYVSVDLEKGEWTSLQNLKNDGADGLLWDFVETMASDPVSGKLMGIAHSRRGFMLTDLVEINPETGDYTKVAELNDLYSAMVYDAKGTLYVLRSKIEEYQGSPAITGSVLAKLDPEQGYAEVDPIELSLDDDYYISWAGTAVNTVTNKVTGEKWDIWDANCNSMYFDPATGELWMLLVDGTTNNQYLFTCDIATGALTKHGKMGFGDVAKGLYIPGVMPDALDAASSVTNLSSFYDATGKVTLKWTNPTTTYSKEELTELAEVRIYRDGKDEANLVATLTDVTPGKEMSWTDDKAEQGLHIYYIIPCRRAGEKGVEESWRAFSGRDVPGKPENLAIQKNADNTITLTWEAAEHGANDGWYDQAGVTYTVVRQPDGVEVKSGITELTFTDTNLGLMQYYSYTVYGVTADGKGTPATSDEVLAGTSHPTPYSTDFDTEELAGQWFVLDNDQNGFTFSYDQYFKRFRMDCVGDDDYLFSPDIALKAGKTYKVKATVYIHYCATDTDPEFVNSFRITAGQGQTAEAQTNELYSTTDYQTLTYYADELIECTFTPDADGDYNFAFHSNNPAGYSNILGLSAFEVYEMQDNDMTALELVGTVNPTEGTESNYTVRVKNLGAADVNNYKVQVVRLDGDNKVVIGETEVSEALKTDEVAEIKVAATPDKAGKQQFAGVVVLDNDPVQGNNMSPALDVEASKAGIVPFNLIVDGDLSSGSTRTGISFFKYYSHFQHLYYPEEFGDFVQDGENIIIHRLALEYDSNTPVTEEFEVKVYMMNTTVPCFTSDTKAWVALEDMTHVYTGRHVTEEGNDHKLIFDFDQPFTYDPTGNLMVAFVKSGSASDKFPTIFRTFNDDWNAIDYRTLRHEDSSATIPEAGVTGIGLADVPYLDLAVSTEKSTGIENMTVGGGFGFADGKFSFNGVDAASLAVFDIAGRLVADKAVTGSTADVNLAAGVYVVKVTATDGKTFTKKIVVRK